MTHLRDIPQQVATPPQGGSENYSPELPETALHSPIIDTAPGSIADLVLSSRERQEMDDRLSSHESELACIIQRSVLPEQLPETPGYSLGAFCLTANEVGGDLYDAVALGASKVMLVVADVMGSGLPAALFAAKLRTLIRTVSSWNGAPGPVLTKVNQLMFEELSNVDTFITAQLALLDTAERQLRVASAGHCPLLFTSKDQPVQPLAPEGMPLGILPDVAFEERTLPLLPTTHALLYTDGIVEAPNSQGDPYGQKRLKQWFWQAARLGTSAAQLRQNFLAHLGNFQGTLKPHDDQTFLILAPEPLPQAFAV